jgi:hypothetical protein
VEATSFVEFDGDDAAQAKLIKVAGNLADHGALTRLDEDQVAILEDVATAAEMVNRDL